MAWNNDDPQYAEAMSFYLAGDWSKANTAFSELAKHNPNDGFVQLLRGNILYSLGNLDDSVEAYERAVEINPKLGIAYYKLGVCYYRMGKLERALKAFSTVSEIGSESHAMASYFVGLINLFLGRDGAADSAFTAFRKQSPESYIANFYLAQLKMKQKAYDQALPLLEELVEGNQSFAEVHYMLGVVQYGLHNNTEAIKCFQKAVELNPEDERSKTKLTLLTDVQWP
ncbi:MAG: tetratricopeptide repeat protein [Spirochaeta sp.]|nr:tetratricopeptide repeat protein [Spirochaeta sp.]